MSDQRIHIVFIIQSLGVGGAEWSVVNLINESDASRFRFSIIVLKDVLTLRSAIRVPDVEIRFVPKRGKLSLHLVGDLKKALIEMRADIVHTHLFTADIWSSRAARELELPIVCTEHNVNIDYGWARNFLKRWVGFADRFVACSETVRQYMVEAYAIKTPIAVIPNGIPLAPFLAIPPIGATPPWRLAIIGRLVEQKGHVVALRALADLRDFDWTLTIVGQGKIETDVREEVNRLGLAARVQFRPFTVDVPTVLGETDIVLIPSLFEGLGVVAREAMAAGRLVIASDTGGLAESILPGQTGWLVPVGDIDAWREKIYDCFGESEDEVGETMRVAGTARAFAREYFGVEKMIAAYEEIYLSLL